MKFHFVSILFLPFAVTAADTNDPSALAPAYGEIPPTFWEQHGTTIIVASLVFVVLATLLIWKLLQPKPPVVIPPEVLAREALAKLQGQSEDGKLLSEVSQILRHYVAAVFDLPSGELTTTEFLTAVARHEKIPIDLGETVCGFLRECDVRKFSPANAAAPINAVARALEFISLAEKRRAELAAKTSTAK